MSTSISENKRWCKYEIFIIATMFFSKIICSFDESRRLLSTKQCVNRTCSIREELYGCSISKTFPPPILMMLLNWGNLLFDVKNITRNP